MSGPQPLVVYVTPTAGERVAFTYQETADLLGVSKLTVRQAVAAGDLHVVELGPQVRRIPAWSIDQLLGRAPAHRIVDQVDTDRGAAA